MLKLRIALICLCIVFLSSVTACASREPVLSSEAVELIEKKLGYVLAPTYMPEGFEYVQGIAHPLASLSQKYKKHLYT